MLRRLIIRSSLVLASGGLAVGCGLFFDPDTLGDASGATSGDAEAGTSTGDASTTPPEAEASAPCPSGEGPTMVRVDDFCIDSTEVTGAQYARFVAAMGKDAGGPDLPQCKSNTSFEPVKQTGFPAPPPETPEFPVHGVDWCDAKAYCKWTGKDLCGGLGGTKLTVSAATDATKSQWAKACSKNGTQRFGYSDSYANGRCADGDKDVSPVNAKCEGGYPGLFDLVGNVAEWIDACEPPLDPQAPCALVGGWAGSGDIASCTSADSPQGAIPWGNAGIRCCAPVTE